jgi:hypothetical protein
MFFNYGFDKQLGAQRQKRVLQPNLALWCCDPVVQLENAAIGSVKNVNTTW